MRISILIGLLLAPVLSYAQVQNKKSEVIRLTLKNLEIKSELRGTILSSISQQPLPLITVYLIRNEKIIRKVQSDFNGHYLFNQVTPGEYSINAVDHSNHINQKLNGIKLKKETTHFIDVKLETKYQPKIIACGFTLKTINRNDKIVDLFEEEKLNSDSLDTLLPGYQPIHNPTKSSITIYPNPSSGLVNITNPLISQALTLYDLSGKIVYQMDHPALTTVSIDLSNFQNGIYILRSKDENGVQVHRIIKN